MTHMNVPMQVVGFRTDAAFVRAAARKLGVRASFAETSSYPSGEASVRSPISVARRVVVAADAGEEPSSFFRLLLLAEALRSSGARRLTLFAPWIAYGRQDRPSRPGESPAGLVVARSLASAFDRIVTLDAHSERFRKAFRRRLVNVLPDPGDPSLDPSRYDLVAAPDRGAVVRAKRFADAFDLPLLAIGKRRVGKTVVAETAEPVRLDGLRVLLVDDMADSGLTLIAAAKLLRASGARAVDAYVTHAFDLRDLRRRCAPCVGRIETGYDHASRRLSAATFDRLARTVR